MTRALPPVGAGDAWEAVAVLEVPDGAGGFVAVTVVPEAVGPPFDREAFDAQLARWKAWAEPAVPSSMRDEPVLAYLRERWPLAGGGAGPRDHAFAAWSRGAPVAAPVLDDEERAAEAWRAQLAEQAACG